MSNVTHLKIQATSSAHICYMDRLFKWWTTPNRQIPGHGHQQRPEVEHSHQQNLYKCKQNTRFLEKEHQDQKQSNLHSCIQTLVCPQVQYASTVWSPFTQTYINNLDRNGPKKGHVLGQQHLFHLCQCEQHAQLPRMVVS